MGLTAFAQGLPATNAAIIAATGASLPPPRLYCEAGVDRDLVMPGKTYLTGYAGYTNPKSPPPGRRGPAATTPTAPDLPATVAWSKESGPGTVTFADPRAGVTTATFSETGAYILKLSARNAETNLSSTLTVKVQDPPPKDRLDVVYTKNYQLDSPLWNDRAKSLIVGWIPHCIDEINDPNLKEGGINNFIEAGKKLRGEPAKFHVGYPFANAWVHQTVEAICLALMLDPKGDPDILQARQKMRDTLDAWIPIILAAQEPDGYLQTRFTLGAAADRGRPVFHWDPRTRGEHEGYVAGYFLESAINHFTMTGGNDTRLYDAAKKLADCWVANLGPGKKTWFDGHQEIEQALVRFGRFVNDNEGRGRGDSYIALAKFLLDSRAGGSEYDQSHLPVTRQYEAVGHAVRAAYTYSGMADVAAETRDTDYQSAVLSLWDNIINKKYYVTGGIGSGETSEGFGPNFSLPNNAYCESCSSCGLIFFQYNMNLLSHDAKYADLYEETLFNALLGATDLDGRNFYYDNPLLGGRRAPWNQCPCCVGNIPRTLLMLPTWTYLKGPDSLYVNLYLGSSINVGKIAGADIQIVQKTDYPWSGWVSLTVNPKDSRTFTIYLRAPNRGASQLYTQTPAVNGLLSLSVNGQKITPKIEKGYAAITRLWTAGDQINLLLPMQVQRVTADPRIAADQGLLCLRYGPLIFNVERADNVNLDAPIGPAPLTTAWRPDLLHGVITINGAWADGSPLLAIPNFARNNRLDQLAAVPPSAGTNATQPFGPGGRSRSQVWFRAGPPNILQ